MNRRNTICASLVAVLAITMVAIPGPEAQVVRHSGGDGGDLVILRELGIVAGPLDGSEDLQVMTLLPDAAGKSDVTIERGDLLLMVAGKRIRDVATLRELYDSAEVGETLKLGFRRGDERFLVSFEKEEAPQGQMRMVMMGGPGEGGGDLQPLMEFGVVLTETDGKVVVGMEMPMDEVALAKDDVITAVNGQPIDSLAAFREAYEAAKVGDDLALAYTHDGEEMEATRAKSDSPGAVRVRRGS